MKTYEYGDPTAKTVLIQPVDGQDLSVMESELEAIGRLSGKKFRLIAVNIENWNTDLSPWKAPAVFGREDFGDGAKDTLKDILSLCTDPDAEYIIGGYSLAGLFSLWAAYQTDRFTAVAAASPSVWFPGFVDFMKNSGIMTEGVYLSLGDREEKARNPVMATVGNCIREAYGHFRSTGTDTVLEWNEGNHFRESDIRTAKAFAWALNRKEK